MVFIVLSLLKVFGPKSFKQKNKARTNVML
jgi:hypothetical protein